MALIRVLLHKQTVYYAVSFTLLPFMHFSPIFAAPFSEWTWTDADLTSGFASNLFGETFHLQRCRFLFDAEEMFSPYYVQI